MMQLCKRRSTGQLLAERPGGRKRMKILVRYGLKTSVWGRLVCQKMSFLRNLQALAALYARAQTTAMCQTQNWNGSGRDTQQA